VPVSEADLTLVRRAFDEFGVSREGLDDYYRRFFVPHGVVEFVDGFPVTGRYEGVAGYRHWFEDGYGPYEDVHRRLDSLTAEGDRILALLTVTGREQGDNVELTVQLGNTYELEDGRISYLRVYVGHDRALAAAREE
jgi:hypothetical protein